MRRRFGRTAMKAATRLFLLALACCAGCGPAALLLMTVAGGAAAMSGEPQRLYSAQGADFDDSWIGRIRSGQDTPVDVVGLFGHPQNKVFTADGEEWAYRYYVPPSMFRAGIEKMLTIRFRQGKVEDVRYSVSAL